MLKKTVAIGLLSVCVSAHAFANQYSNEVEGFKGFTHRIEFPKPLEEVNPSARDCMMHPLDGFMPQRDYMDRESPFKGWNRVHPYQPVIKTLVINQGEQMDSLITTTLSGKKVSKQTYLFTTYGKPSECRNFIVSDNGMDFIYDGHYAYEYDDQKRLISAENLSLSAPYWFSERYEFIYDGYSSLYSSQISYQLNEEREWLPYQRADYTFDDNNNTTSETYLEWDKDKAEWTPYKKTVASYDELNRLISYFPYIWDDTRLNWTGEQYGDKGQSYTYTLNGSPAIMSEYTWENDAWLEYHRLEFTYEDALEVRRESLYWNRDRQDWSGADAYGQWGNMMYNKLVTKEYDEYGRAISENSFTSRTGDYMNNWRQTWEYEDLGDDIVEIISVEMNVKSDGTIVPTNKTLSHTLGLLDLYYISYSYDNGEWIPTNEEKRSLDENGYYISGEFLSYYEGEVLTGTKEVYSYSDDFNPQLGYDTPIEGLRYALNTMVSPEWLLIAQTSFTWGPRGVLIGFVQNVPSDNNEMTPKTGYEAEYDFSADMANIWIWPDANRGKNYVENKILKEIDYVNWAYDSGNTEWEVDNSLVSTFYYSDRATSEVINVGSHDKLEIERFDIYGNRLSGPVKGINIILYSDGSAEKKLCE